jgi:hypothetical protein
MKRALPSSDGDTVPGYVSMIEVSKDLGEVIDVLWLSGTRKYHKLSMLEISTKRVDSKPTSSLPLEHCTCSTRISPLLPCST